jgi:hypothetical protein
VKASPRRPAPRPVQQTGLLAAPLALEVWTLEQLGVPLVEFAVAGDPAPEGSYDPLVNPRTGRAQVVPSNAAWLDVWRDAVQDAAKAHTGSGWVPVDGPLVVDLEFSMPRGKRPASRVWASTPPDLSKLVRATEDALNPVRPPAVNRRTGKVRKPRHPRPPWQGLWVDDARVVAFRSLLARYAGAPGALAVPGAVVRVWSVP